MGEAKRRKQRDNNFGKREPEKLFAGLTLSAWREQLGFSLSQWGEIQPYFREVSKINQIDRYIDGVWIYPRADGTTGIFFTGKFYDLEFLFSLPSQVETFYGSEVENLLEDDWDDEGENEIQST